MNIQYQTADSRLAAFLQVRGVPLFGTETRYQGEEDRVHLLFEVDDKRIAELKREFFEGASAPALELLNAHKATMHTIRQARELAREQH
jgi:hypothetical protein